MSFADAIITLIALSCFFWMLVCVVVTPFLFLVGGRSEAKGAARDALIAFAITALCSALLQQIPT